ncbi:alpha/beta hydrolase [Chryseobacterium paridis]|uniref:Proline iminopeptidase n=1 Tax=Chryseobacterium paridis TaxID=2800328 RepID=A0ABS1FUX0_9FLAO|nr:alpha/beta hydrolase [Chryseobacterium paridis]MBK1896212.1 alpha/beta hydrolase [Chryseobacterium paridis]
MKTQKVIFLLLMMVSSFLFAQKGEYTITKTKPFFDVENLKDDQSVEWGYLSVPESWIAPSSKIKIAYVVLKKKKQSTQKPLVYIEGGPGQSGVGAFGYFRNHPLRDYSDIILVDARGVGNSLPKLCPELGTEIFKILSSNESSTADEKNRSFAAMNCKNELIRKGIDPANYSSINIANDLHALKKALHYDKWNVLGVSYGTYISQVYANSFPEDFNKMILDSPVDNISEYYNKINDHYVKELNIFFAKCKQNPAVNKKFPNLEKTYYEVIEDLAKNPLTVGVPKDLLEKGSFTFNSEDFKIVIHQALYTKQLIEVLPVIITLFHKRDAETLSSIVGVFSGVFKALDFGTYYSMVLNDAIPYNSLKYYDEDAANYPGLKGGLSFYRADFLVGSQWNNNKQVPQNILDYGKMSKIPTMIMGGEFDPITPVSNAQSLAGLLKAQLIIFKNEGHALLFGKEGSDLINNFINDKTPLNSGSTQVINSPEVRFITDIHINSGITKLAMLLFGGFDILKVAPLILAYGILLVAIIFFSVSIWRRRKVDKLIMKAFYGILIINCIIGVVLMAGLIYAIVYSNNTNFFICAFGIPEKFINLFYLLKVHMILFGLSFILFLVTYRQLTYKIIVISVLFSFILILSYFYYWGFFS